MKILLCIWFVEHYDRNGGAHYSGFRITDTRTRATVSGYDCPRSNLESNLRELGFDSSQWYLHSEEMKSRQFDKFRKDLPICYTSAELAARFKGAGIDYTNKAGFP